MSDIRKYGAVQGMERLPLIWEFVPLHPHQPHQSSPLSGGDGGVLVGILSAA